MGRCSRETPGPAANSWRRWAGLAWTAPPPEGSSPAHTGPWELGDQDTRGIPCGSHKKLTLAAPLQGVAALPGCPRHHLQPCFK